jgi:hypothetical protein
MNCYFRLCEQMWQQWLAGEPTATEAVRRSFDLDAAPEPYLPFQPGDIPLVVLTTNPGATMPHQRREQIMENRSVLTPQMPYAEAAEVLSRFYCDHLSGQAARRIAAQRELARKSGYSGVLQVECCPWHSAALSGKTAFMKVLAGDDALMEYVSALRTFLEPQPVLVISAVSSRDSLDAARLSLSPWLDWQLRLIALQQAKAERVALVSKGVRVTCTALVDRSGPAVKAAVLMQGSNQLPGPAGRETLASALH